MSESCGQLHGMIVARFSLVETGETFHSCAWRREDEYGGLALVDVRHHPRPLLVAGQVEACDDVEVRASAVAPTNEQCARFRSASA